MRTNYLREKNISPNWTECGAAAFNLQKCSLHISFLRFFPCQNWNRTRSDNRNIFLRTGTVIVYHEQKKTHTHEIIWPQERIFADFVGECDLLCTRNEEQIKSIFFGEDKKNAQHRLCDNSLLRRLTVYTLHTDSMRRVRSYCDMCSTSYNFLIKYLPHWVPLRGLCCALSAFRDFWISSESRTRKRVCIHVEIEAAAFTITARKWNTNNKIDIENVNETVHK